MARFKLILYACFTLCLSSTSAADPALEELYPGATQISVVREAGGHIVILAPNLVRTSNPATKRWSNQKILLAIKKAVSLLRNSQLEGVGAVSTSIKSEDPDPDAEAFGLPVYGRALIAKIKIPEERGSVLLDLKGTGTEEPSTKFNSNGLLSLPVALKEFVVAHLIQKIFEYAGIEYGSVPHIAVSASHFFIKKTDGSVVMAAKLVRAPHRRLVRPNQTHFFVHYQPALQIEQLLQLFGISSLQTLDGESFLNIQGTPFNQLFDFSHYSLTNEGAQMPPEAFAYFNAVPGNSNMTVPYQIAAHFPKPIPRIGLIHNLLGDFSGDKIYGEILRIYERHCATSSNCDRAKLFEALSMWTQNLLNQVDTQLGEKSFTDTVMERLGPKEGAEALARIYPAFRLNKKGQSELRQLLSNPRHNSADASRLEILWNHTDLEMAEKNNLPEARPTKTDFIRNVSAQYRKFRAGDTIGKPPFEEDDPAPPQETRIPDETKEVEKSFCSGLVRNLRNFFKLFNRTDSSVGPTF